MSRRRTPAGTGHAASKTSDMVPPLRHWVLAGLRLLRAPRRLRPFEAVVAVAALAVVALGSTAALQPAATRSIAQAILSSPLPASGSGTAPAGPSAPGPAAPPAVAPLHRLVEADLLISSGHPLGARAERLVRALPGVRHTLALAAGGVIVAGHHVQAVAADPSLLRAWTPAPTARSDAFWRTLAGGAVAASFDAGKNLGLVLGGQLALRAAHGPGWALPTLGALASTGFAGVDLTMAPETGQALGLTPDAALVVSAPGADLSALRDRVRAALGPHASVEVLLQTRYVVLRDAGSFLTRWQVATVVRAALSRVGAPYVWGATGPNSFDCSGLVGYAFAAAGIAMPRTSEQLWFAGVHVDPSQARPGDLLFWANDPTAPGDIDHVAIYLGNGLMVAAPHTGAQVRVTSVDSQNFRGVVRVDPAAAARVGGPMWALGEV